MPQRNRKRNNSCDVPRSAVSRGFPPRKGVALLRRWWMFTACQQPGTSMQGQPAKHTKTSLTKIAAEMLGSIFFLLCRGVQIIAPRGQFRSREQPRSQNNRCEKAQTDGSEDTYSAKTGWPLVEFVRQLFVAFSADTPAPNHSQRLRSDSPRRP